MESPDTANRQNEKTKKPYRTPALTDYGTVAQVTQAGGVITTSDGTSLSS